MNWLVKWYWLESGANIGDCFVKSKILKLCDTYEKARCLMYDLIRGPAHYGWFNVEKNG